jgi:hypothetical protein
VRLKVRGNIIELPESCAGSDVFQVYDSKGNDFRFSKQGRYVEITGGERKLRQNEAVDARFRASLVSRMERAVLDRAGNGFYRVPGIDTAPSKIEGVYYKASGDVLKIGRLETPLGEAVEITGYRKDCVQIKTDADYPFLAAYDIEYILPFKFIVLSQNLNKEDLGLVSAHQGDAVCTYPYMYNVAENDVITVLSGTMTHKILMAKKSGAADDIIPEFFVSKVAALETKAGEFKEGEDFTLAGTNRIHWLGDKKPEAGEVMSLAYLYHPTYRAVKNIPMLRTSEDQRMPRKAVLKLYSAFGENKGVNRNG